MSERASRPWMGPLPAAPGCDCQICRPEASYDEQDRSVVDTVLEHGWQVILVSDEVACEDPDHDHDEGSSHSGESAPAFAYTVGLGHRGGHPELLMSGLPLEMMHRSLNQLARRVLAGRRLSPGDVVEDVLAGVPVVLERVVDPALSENVAWSGWFHRRPPEALAVVWPTTTGLFAWQPGAPAILDELQPPAWREPSGRRGGVAADPEWEFPVPPEQQAFSCTHVVDEGAAILWAARESDPERGEDWSIHCGAAGHTVEEMRLVHLAHLVRSSPSLSAVSGMALDHEAERADTDAAWSVTPVQRTGA